MHPLSILVVTVIGSTVVGWLAAWRERALASYFCASALAFLGGMVIAVSVFVPRRDLGAYGQGDGFGVIGLMVAGAAIAGLGALLAALTALVAWGGRRWRNGGARR